METLPCEASAFRFTWNKTEESHSYLFQQDPPRTGENPARTDLPLLSREDTHTAERFYPSGHTLPLHHVKEQDDAEAPCLWSRAAVRERRAWWR